jgi:hypothetical protein
MPIRRLRIVKTTPRLMGVCEECSSEFTSDALDVTGERAAIRVAFESHKCVPLDSSQNALRVVREATENK